MFVIKIARSAWARR